MRTRVFQVPRDVRKHGKRHAPWYIEWKEENGRRRSENIGSMTKAQAQDLGKAKHLELAKRKFGLADDKTWNDFYSRYDRDYIETEMPKPASRQEARRILKRFGEIMKPQTVEEIDDLMIAEYVAKRRKDRGAKKGDTLSAATIRKELRTIRAALNMAKRWKYTDIPPEMPRVKGIEPEKRFVTEEHFEAMLAVLDRKNPPVTMPYGPDHDGQWIASDWWRALLVWLWVTGMRITATLTMRWEHVDLESGVALSRGWDNKGGRAHRVKIGPVVDLLTTIRGDDPHVFPCHHNKTTRYSEFIRLQQAAGIHLPCVGSDEHECTDKFHAYGFHDFRRAHATYNYGKVSDRDLQQQMGHAAFSTTRKYAKYAQEHADAAYDVHLPASLKAQAKGLKIADGTQKTG